MSEHDPIVVVQRPKTTEEQLQVQVDELKSEKSQLEDIVRLKEERLVELEAEVVAMTDRLKKEREELCVIHDAHKKRS